MIGWLRGVVREREASGVILDVGGVGWLVRVPMSTFLSLPPVGEAAELRVTTHVREDAITLFGFATSGEQALFDLLNSVSGVGPRTALAALSTLGAEALAQAIVEGDARRLSAVPGIGKKTGERIVIDLRDKVVAPVASKMRAAGAGADPADAVSALVNLGYSERHAANAVSEARAAGLVGFEALLRDALTRIGRG
jgi:Holliday junction DNA helicase RuvA